MRDSSGSVRLPLGGMRFYAKNRSFLTHSRLDATYIERASGHSLSRSRQSIATAQIAGHERRAQQ
jgi:hypothetical protein